MSGKTPSSAPHRVEVIRKSLERYRQIVGDDLVAEIRDRAHDLRGLRVLELSATATGGGVAEMLSSLVPLQRDAGLDVEWELITADADFFETTKKLHNGLQGMEVEIDEAERATTSPTTRPTPPRWPTSGTWSSSTTPSRPPSAPLRQSGRASGSGAATSIPPRPTPRSGRLLRPYVEAHDHAVFTLAEFVPPDLAMPVSTHVPAIDPLTSKNRLLPSYLARQTVADLGSTSPGRCFFRSPASIPGRTRSASSTSGNGCGRRSPTYSWP